MLTVRQAAFVVAGWGAIFGYMFGHVMGAFVASGAVYASVRMLLRDYDGGD